MGTRPRRRLTLHVMIGAWMNASRRDRVTELVGLRRSGACNWRPSRASRCWNEPSSAPSRRPTSTSSSRSGWRPSRTRCSAGIEEPTPDGRTPVQQLRAINERAQGLIAEQERVFIDGLVPALADAGIEIVRWVDHHRRRAQATGRVLRATDLPRPHPAGGGPQPPVPLHLEPCAQRRRARGRPRDRGAALCPSQGADLVPPVGRGQPRPA